jgi:isopentenyl phosphate kinase
MEKDEFNVIRTNKNQSNQDYTGHMMVKLSKMRQSTKLTKKCIIYKGVSTRFAADFLAKIL